MSLRVISIKWNNHLFILVISNIVTENEKNEMYTIPVLLLCNAFPVSSRFTTMDWSASHSRPYQPESGSKVMNIQRSSNADDILRDYQVLQQRGTFTDINFVLRDGVVISAHSLIFAASSALVKEWMETTTIWPSNKVRRGMPSRSVNPGSSTS